MSRGSFGGGRATAANFSHRFTNSVRPQTSEIHHKKPLPRRNEENIGVDDASSTNEGDFEQAIALHNCKQAYPLAFITRYDIDFTFLLIDQGSPDDPNELSFQKDEMLEILDKRGNWWQARKADGTTGIVPSNYVSLIHS